MTPSDADGVDGPPEAVPTTTGHLVVDDDALRIESDVRGFVRGQGARWDDGDAARRFLMLYEYLVPLGLLWAAAVLYDPGAVRPTVVAVGAVAVAAYFLLSRTLPSLDVAVDYDDVRAIDLGVPDRTVDLEYAASEPTRWAFRERETYERTVRFTTEAAAERARRLLDERPVADRLTVTEAGEEAVDTDHRVVVDDGVLFCEQCGWHVSPTHERCPNCEYGIRADVPAEPPSGSSTRDEDDSVTEPERETETVYRVETEDGVPFCEHCGAKVSPTADTCRSCGDALRVERVVNVGDDP